MAGWYQLSFSTTIQFFRYYLEFFAIVGLVIAVVSGISIWRMAGDVNLVWDADAVVANELLMFDGSYQSLVWLIVGLAVVQWLLNILFVSFVNEVFILRGVEAQPSTFQLLGKSARNFGIYLGRALLLLIVVIVAAVLPGLLIGVFVDSFFGFTFSFAAAIVINIVGLDWVTRAGFKNVKSGLNNLLSKFGRAFGAGATATFILVAIDAIGTLLISIGSLVERMPTTDLNQDFEIPLRTLLGTNQWVLGLRAIFVVLGLTLATAFWVNSRLVQQELDVELT